MAGNPSSVEDAAWWLSKLGNATSEADKNTGGVRRLSEQVWVGDGGDAYREFNTDMQKCLDELSTRAKDASETFFAFGQQLRYRQQDMSQWRTRAVEGGLVVSETVISPAPVMMKPQSPGDGGSKADWAEYIKLQDEYSKYLKTIDLYAELHSKTTHTFERLHNWIVENLVTTEESLQVPGFTAAMSATGTVATYSLDFGEAAFERKSELLKIEAAKLAKASASRASGNPAVRAGQLEPRQAAVEKRLARSGKLATAKQIGKISKRIGGIGTIVTGVVAVQELAAGGSPAEVGIDVLSGAAGSAAGAVITVGIGLALGITAAPVAVGIGAILGGAILASSSEWLWQHSIPQATREMIDEGITDAWNGVLDWFQGK